MGIIQITSCGVPPCIMSLNLSSANISIITVISWNISVEFADWRSRLQCSPQLQDCLHYAVSYAEIGNFISRHIVVWKYPDEANRGCWGILHLNKWDSAYPFCVFFQLKYTALPKHTFILNCAIVMGLMLFYVVIKLCNSDELSCR